MFQNNGVIITMDTLENESKIECFKQLLSQTDYIALKHLDGAISDAEYEETKNLRALYRSKINELEEET